MTRPYSQAELEKLALKTLSALDGEPLLVVHAVCLVGLIGTIAALREQEALTPALEAILTLAIACSNQANAALAEGPYDGLPVA